MNQRDNRLVDQSLPDPPLAEPSLAAAQEGGGRKASQQETTSTATLADASVALDDNAPKKEKWEVSLATYKHVTALDYILIAISILLNLASGAILPVFLAFFGGLMDSVNNPASERHSLFYYTKAQLISGAASFVLCGLGALSMELVAERQLRAFKTEFFRSLLRQEMGWFDKFDAGELCSTFSQATATMRDAMGIKCAQIFMFLGMFVGGYAVGIYTHWKMALVVSSALPVLGFAAYIMFSALGKSDQLSRKEYSKAGTVVEECLVAFRSVAAFGLERRMFERFKINLKSSFNAGVKGALLLGFGFGGTMGVIFLSYALGFWYGGSLIATEIEEGHSKFTSGKVMTVFFCVLIGCFALGQAGPNIGALSKAGTASKELVQVIERQSQIDAFSEEGIKIAPDQALKGKIEFKNVGFAYPTRESEEVFVDFSLEVEPGQCIALVGSSGCGKSTCVQLLERFYDVKRGTLLIDDVDIRSYNVRSLRRKISLVSQESRLFAASIFENIKGGDRDATEEQVVQAAKLANAHDFIMQFPQKYQTFVGEGGGQLSGGQKQRIAIARAILKKPSILILDEATSALDNESERVVQETLDRLVSSLNQNRITTVIVAHRFSTIRNADKIAVLDNAGTGLGAKVVELGTHEELMAISDGLYRELVNAQQVTQASRRLSGDEPEVLGPLTDQFHKDIASRSHSLINLKKKFSKDYSRAGSVVLTEDAKKAQEAPRDLELPVKGIFRKTLGQLRHHEFMLLLGLLGAALNGCVFPCFSIVLSKVVAAFYDPDPVVVRREGRFWALIFLGFAAGVFVANVLQHSTFGWAGQKIAYELRLKTFETMLHQDVEFFDNPQHTTGVLTEVLASDAISLKGWIGDNMGIHFMNIVALTAALIISFSASAKLAAVALASFVAIVPAAVLEARLMASGSTKKDTAPDGTVNYDSIGFIFQEVILNIKSVNAFTLEQSFLDRFGVLVTRDFDKGWWNSWLVGGVWGFTQLAQFYAQALCLWYGGHLVEKGEIKGDEMLRAIFGLIMAAMGVGQTSMLVTDNTKGRVAATRIYRILERPRLRDARSLEGLRIERLDRDINFESANFRYTHRRDVGVYQNISFTIPKGQVVALVGASGCGKSTVVQLLERFYDLGDSIGVTLPLEQSSLQSTENQGVIKLGDSNIKDLNVKTLRECIGLVSQEPVLFACSVKQNILMGIADGRQGTDEEVVNAAKLANAHEFISKFPLGYDTPVGKMGGQISGGQKQRIAIARAIIRNPTLLILDEATSALDPTSEKVVQEALDNIVTSEQRTTLVIAHRLSTVKNAHKIVVLVNHGEGSSVAEEGTHSSLMEIPGGIYRKLVEIANIGTKK